MREKRPKKKRGRDAKAGSKMKTPRSMILASSQSAAGGGSSPSQVLMRANAHPHRKLKGGRPFGRIIPPVPAPPFFMLPLD